MSSRTLLSCLPVVALAISLLACSGGSGTSGGAGAVTSASQDPASRNRNRVSFPQAVKGPADVMDSPTIVPVFWSNDAPSDVSTLGDFFGKLPDSDYWPRVTGEYDVGPLSTANTVTVTDAPPATITSDDLAFWLAGQVSPLQPGWKAPGDNTIYALMPPPGMIVTIGGTDVCEFALGYHTAVRFNDTGLDVIMTVVPRCLGGLGSPNTPTGLDSVTAVLAHELVEASTDALPGISNGYHDVDDEHIAWQLAGGGEIGDLCEGRDWSFYRDEDTGAMVQRIWSNRAAREHRDPCAPKIEGQAYYSAFPRLDDDLQVTVGTRQVTTRGIVAPVGQTVTVDVALFADEETDGPWTLSTFTVSPNITMALDQKMGSAGDHVQLSVTRSAADASPGLAALGSKLNGVPYFTLFLIGQ